MRGPSPYVLAAVAAFSASVAALSPLVPSARGDLDRIAADGVTERGGSAEYARMLPRTGPGGVLDASLLPPVADWASQPISNLYYLAGNAAVQGNGSPQYPFKELTYALSHMAPGSALLVAPATYSGVLSLPSGQAVTLVGMGPSAYVSSLAVAASGSSSATRLALVGMNVGVLSLSGGTVEVRLSHSVVGRLEGTASAATVTRTDMGSAVVLSTLTHVDSYVGYDTAPRALMLTAAGATTQLTLSGGRPVVSDGGSTHAVAYVSDVVDATNDVNGALQGLRDADAALGGRVDEEVAARKAGDAALSNRLDGVKATLGADIARIGTHWGSQLSNFSAALDAVYARLDALHTTETNDVRSLQRSIASVAAAYAAADAEIRADLATLQADVSTLDAGLNSRIDTRADARIDAARDDIVSTAMNRAVDASRAYTDSVKANLTATIDANHGVLQTRLSTAESSLIQLKGKINDLIVQLSKQDFTNDYSITLPTLLP